MWEETGACACAAAAILFHFDGMNPKLKFEFDLSYDCHIAKWLYELRWERLSVKGGFPKGDRLNYTIKVNDGWNVCKTDVMENKKLNIWLLLKMVYLCGEIKTEIKIRGEFCIQFLFLLLKFDVYFVGFHRRMLKAPPLISSDQHISVL